MMKKMTILASFFLAAGLFGCYYDVEEELYPGTAPCSTTGVTYSGTIVPILQTGGCLGCHSGGAPSGNLNLSNYETVHEAAHSGRLFGAISHAPGFSPMPKGGNQLDACTIARVKAWIDAGAPNN
ncbi:MAG TPA: hypothetical protein VHK69_11845 [Chitinophagaceae bacterium]|jgi:hypothetical protein|nr:hypothetical protein [Chitinophagaceae bacterium]